MDTKIAILLGATFSVAFFHTLSPDHWLPFVMVGRAQRWSILKTELIAFLAGAGHVGSSVVISLIGIFIGAELSQNFASIAETATGGALVLFGFGYALYMWSRGGHRHFAIGANAFGGGHHSHEHSTHTHAPLAGQTLAEASASIGGGPREHCHEHELDIGDGHAHRHSHGGHDHLAESPAGSRAGYGLVAIMGLTPCIALLPVAFASATYGLGMTVIVLGLFTTATIIPTLGLVFLGSKGLGMLRLRWFDNYGDVITGVVIGCIGLLTALAGL